MKAGSRKTPICQRVGRLIGPVASWEEGMSLMAQRAPSGCCSLDPHARTPCAAGSAAHDKFSIHDSAGVAPRFCPSAPSVHRDEEGYGVRLIIRAAPPKHLPPNFTGRGPERDDARSSKQNSAVETQAYLAGLYQLSRPFWSFSPATSGVSVPLMTLADSVQVSFSRFGVPRDRIW